jgi:hypothetical protein
VPVAGEDAAAAEDRLAQRIALVGTTVGAGEEAAGRPQQEDLAALVADDKLALGLELLQRRDIDPGHGDLLMVSGSR